MNDVDLSPETVLAACVAEAVGAAAEPRPGQASLAMSMARAFSARGHCLAKAPTGTGKSLAALSQAGLRALRGERTVISTHALTLQDQYLTKDAPPMLAAIERLSGRRLKVAVLKGGGNYASISKLSGFLHFAGIPVQLGSRSSFSQASLAVSGLSDSKALAAAEAVSWLFKQAQPRPSAAEIIDIVSWALEAHLDDAEPGDRQSSPAASSDALWSIVSGGGSGAVAARRKKGQDAPAAKVDLAKERCAEADIVLTNHALLGIRAATGRQIVLDSPALGPFDHVIVDEAHLLPGIVRDQGSRGVSSKSISRIQAAARDLSRSAAMTSWAVRGDRIRAILDQRLSPLRGQSLAPEDDPIAAVRPEIEQWLASASDVVRAVRGSASPMHRERFVEAVMDLEESLEATIEHRLGAEVRWVSDDQQHPGLSCAPVDVGGLLWRNVWNRPAIEGRDIDDRALVSAGRGDGLVPLGMACMSATLGVNAKQELGASIGVVEHESPFLAAYAASALHIPVLGADWWAGVDRDGRFDLDAHEVWARGHAERLVRANGGRALLLTAKSSTGKALADHLRAAEIPGVRIYSQWDGDGLDQAKARWLADEHSVLVGSKSLMTGVDAPGETCSLVWLDRPPRRPGNPVDDGRVDARVARGQNRYVAREQVYAGDAADDVEQAAGRLIRSMSCGGMVAIADPRLAAGQPRTYGDVTRSIYLKPLAAFGHRIPSEDDAAAWLLARRGALA